MVVDDSLNIVICKMVIGRFNIWILCIVDVCVLMLRNIDLSSRYVMLKYVVNSSVKVGLLIVGVRLFNVVVVVGGNSVVICLMMVF